MSNWWDNAPVIDQPAESGSEWWKSAPEVPPSLARAEEDKAQMLPFARKRIEGAKNSPLLSLLGPPVSNADKLATAVGLGTSVVAPAARALGFEDTADRLNRFGDAYEQAASERDQKGVVPSTLKRAVRGAGKTLPTTVVAGHFLGPYGAIGTAALQERDQAITEARDMGLPEDKVQEYANTQGLVEGAVAAAFQRLGLGGLESAVTRQTASKSVVPALKQLAKDLVLGELPEEIITETAHSGARREASGKPFSTEELLQTWADTAVQTAMTMGAAEAPNIAQASVEGKARAQRLAQLKALRTVNGADLKKEASKLGINTEGLSRQDVRGQVNLEIKREEEIQNEPEVPPAAQAEEVRQAEPVQGEIPAGEAEVPQVPVEAPAQVPIDQDIMAAVLAAEQLDREAPAPVPEETIAQGPTDIKIGKKPEAPVEEAVPKPKIGRKPEAPKTIDLGGMGTAISDNFYDSILKSLKDKGEVPGMERKSSVGKAWDRVRGTMSPEQFIASLRKDGADSVQKPPESLPAAPQQELTSEPTKAVTTPPAAPHDDYASFLTQSGIEKQGGVVSDKVSGPVPAKKPGNKGLKEKPPEPAAIPEAVPTPDATNRVAIPQEPWQMTYKELRNSLNPANREELERSRPLLKSMYKPDDPTITANEHDDPWGIHRAITNGDSIPRVPMHDLSFRHKAAIREALASGKPVPPEVLKDYPDLVPPVQPKAQLDFSKATPEEIESALMREMLGEDELATMLPEGQAEYEAQVKPKITGKKAAKITGKKPVIDVNAPEGVTLSAREASTEEKASGKRTWVGYASSNEGGYLSVDATGNTEGEARTNALGELVRKQQARKPNKTLKKAASDARGEFNAAVDEAIKAIREAGLGMNQPLNPKVVVPIVKVAAKALKAGVLTFADFVNEFSTKLGRDKIPGLRHYLQKAWDAAIKLDSSKTLQPADYDTHFKEYGNERTDDSAGRDGGRKPATSGATAKGGKAEGKPGKDAGDISREGSRTDAEGSVDDGDRETRDTSGRTSPAEAEETGKTEPRGKKSPQKLQERNHRIGPDDSLTAGGPGAIVARTNANVEAIRIMRDLESSGRDATVEEKKKMAQYVGWGGLSQVFDKGKGESMLRGTQSYYRDEGWEKTWGRFYKELKGDKPGEFTGLLTEEEWDAAAQSTEFAHYTSREVIERMWDAAARLGFAGGKVLEPAAGVGHFFGLMPQIDAELIGVEIDSLSGRIAKQLYPDATVFVQGIEDTKIPANSIDLAISNVPFSSQGPPDAKKRYGKQLNLHNYFLARMIDAVKPGGLVVAISTHNTMDSQTAQRKMLAERAALVGAIRLPNNAFKKNANTDVVTDILFLRKNDETSYKGEAWTDVTKVGEEDGKPIIVNEYFAKHPEMALGTHSLEGEMRGRPGEYTLKSNGVNIQEQMAKAIEALPKDIAGKSAAEEADFGAMGEAKGIPNNTMQLKDGKLVLVQDGKFVSAGELHSSLASPSPATKKQAESYLALKDHYDQHLALMRDPESSDEQVEKSQTKLNTLYDELVKRLGKGAGLNSLAAAKFRDEAGYYRLLGLEKTRVERDPTTGKDVNVVVKSDVFTKRTIPKFQEPTTAGSLKEGIQLSVAFRGAVDLEYVASLTGKTTEEVVSELREESLAFQEPHTGMWVPSFLYLSGNVREKLSQAKLAAADDKAFQKNVEALEKVQPEPVSGSSISVRLAGAHWVPDTILARFAKEKFNDPRMNIRYSPEVDKFYVSGNENSVASSEDYGVMKAIKDREGNPVLNSNGKPLTELKMTGLEVVRHLLNMQEIRIMKPQTDAEGNTVLTAAGNVSMTLDQDATLAAQAVSQRLEREFLEWSKAQEDVMLEIQRAFNDKYNFWVKTQYDPDFLATPGANPNIILRHYQKSAVVRLLMEGHGMLAHGVGSGKTFEAITWALEGKRMGLHKKPMIAVHNITLSQYAEAAANLYPGANVYVARKADLQAGKRKAFMARIAANDYDLIIVPHSSFNLIPNDPKSQEAYLHEQLDELENTIRDLKQNEGKSAPSVKDLERQKRALEDRLGSLMGRVSERAGEDIYFEQLGVDALLVDEAHEFKKPPFVTKLGRLRGLDKQTSQRATALMLKMRAVRGMPGNQGVRGTVLATGTPVTNTLGEAWHMLRLASPSLLEQFGADTFDRFVGTFASVENVLEQNAGGTWRYYPALAKFRNGFSLGQLLGAGWDILTSEELVEYFKSQGEPFPELEGGAPKDVTVPQTPQVKVFTDWLKDIFNAWSNLSGQDKKLASWVPVQVYLAGKAAAMDMRMVKADAIDEPGSKVNTAVQKVLEIYHKTAENKGTQAIFADTMNRVNLTNLAAFANHEDVVMDFDESQGETETAADEGMAINNETAMLYNDIKRKLVDLGIPESEVALISNYKNEADRKGLFERVNSGDVRVVIGGTKTLGTGANIQRRLAAIHNLDIPWTAADFVQRLGRGLRFGNMNKSIQALNYGMEKTTDSSIFGKILRKAAAMDQAMMGKLGSEFDDPFSDVVATAEEMMAAFSGDTRIFEQKQAEADARNLRIEKESLENRLARARERLARDRESLARDKARQAAWEKLIPELPTLDAEGKKELAGRLKEGMEAKEEEILSKTKSKEFEQVKYANSFYTTDLKNHVAASVKVGPVTVKILVGFHGAMVAREGGGRVTHWEPTRKVVVLTPSPAPVLGGDHVSLYDGDAQTPEGAAQAVADAQAYATKQANYARDSQPRYEKEIEELTNVLKQSFPQEKEEKLKIAEATSSRLKEELKASGEAEEQERKAKREGRKSKAQQKADEALGEANDALKSFVKDVGGTTPSSGLNPKHLAGAARVVGLYFKAGYYQFQAFLEKLKESIGQASLDNIMPYLEAEWDKAYASGEFDGMEPRVQPVEKPDSGETTGSKNAKTDEARARAGMEERPLVEPESVEQWQAEAAKRMKDPNYAPKLAEQLAANPKALDSVEQAVMERYQTELENRRKAGEDVLDEIRTAVEADERVGTIWGRAGVSRKVELTADFTVAGITKQHLRSVNKAPTDEQMEKYSEMADRIAALEGELSESQKKLAQAEVDKQIAEAKAAKPTPAKSGGKRAQLKQKASDAVAKFKDKWAALYQLGAVSNPKEDAKKWAEITTAAVDVVKAYAELGVDSFMELMSRVKKDIGQFTSDQKDAFKEAWDQYRAASKTEAPENPDHASLGAIARKLTRWAVESGITEREAVVDAVHQELFDMGFEIERSDTMAAMSGYGDFRELSKDEVSVKVRGIKGELQQILKLEDMQAGQAPAKTGVERRVPTEEERQLIKRVNEAKKRGGYVVTDPAKQLQTALGTAKTAARHRIADLEQAIAKREKIVAGQTKLAPDAELAALQKKRDELNEEYRKIFPAKKSGISEAQRLKMAEAMLDRHIAELKADLAAGRLDPAAKKPGLTSPEIEAKKLQLDLLKQAREQAREASPEYQAKEQAKQNARYKASLERQLALWQERLASGVLPEKRKPTPLDKEMLETKFQIELVKRETRAIIEEAERAARSPTGKAMGFGGDLLDLSQAIMTGFEMSAVLRQGAFYTLGMPRKALDAVKDSVRAAISRRADFSIHDDLMNRPNHVDYMRGGLETTAADGPLSHREELIRSRLASWLSQQKGVAWALPRWAAEGLLGGERAFRTFANTMRADLFDYMKSSIEASRPGTWSEDDAKIVGSASNVFSGRGNLPASLSGVASARILFAPRWVWSRGELLVGRPLWKGDTATRLAVGKVYVRAALGFAAFQLIKHVLYSLLAGDDEHEPEYEIDPRSTDFSKTKIGDTRIDSGAGLSQLIVLASRVATGEKKLASGKVVPIRGEAVPYGADDTFDILGRFLRSKLAPLPSGVLDWVVGENIVGEKATVGKIVGERVTPMTWRDIWKAEEELNVPQGTVAAIEAFFGESVSTYGQKTKFRNADEAGRQKMVFAAFDHLDVSKPKRKDFGSDEKFQAAMTKFIADNERAAEELRWMTGSLGEARTLLREYYLRTDSSGKRGSLREKDSGELKDSYVKKLQALNRLFAE